jgi:isopenicillin-N N-acyltransferase like protein
VVADRTGVAVFEVTPRRVLVRRAEDGLCICTNHFCTPELRPFVRLNIYRTLDRYGILERAASRQEKLGLDELQGCLDAASQGDHTMQTMVFEPAGLRLHLAVGTCPSSAGEFRLLELGPLFQSLLAGAE